MFISKRESLPIGLVLLGAALAMVLSLSLTVPKAGAVTVQDLLAQIQALQAQLAQLQGQSSGSGATACTFTKSLFLGVRDSQVKCLQQYLNSAGYAVSASGAGSVGKETNYYGPATKAAVAKWQAANKVSPAVGYFGKVSRVKYSSVAGSASGTTGGATSGTTSGTTGGTTLGTTVPVPTPLTGQVTVSVGDNRYGGSIISGGAQIPVLNFNLANGTNADVTVTGMKFTKTGVLSDSNISNAYLSRGGEIFAQYIGLSQGVITFTGNVLTVKAGQSENLTLRVDISSGTANGNTISFALANASDLTLSSSSPVSGSFPVLGATFTTTTVTNPSLASITSLNYQGVASQVDAGTLGFRASSLSYTVQNSPIKLVSIKYTISGSLNWQQDLQNAVLRLDGVEVAKGRVDADGKVFFDASANPAIMNTGSHVLEVYVDVLGTANRIMTWQLLRPFEWVLFDTQYNQNLSGGTPGGTATQISVRQGKSTVALASGTPTGNIPLGSTSFVIAKFTYLASGEPVKIKWLPFKITETGSVAAWNTGTAVDSDIRNIAIYSDDGSQLGTTINTPSSCTYGTPETTATTYICAVGSPNSNINFIVPANTTRIFSLRVDIQAGADITTIKGSLISPSQTSGFTGNNFEGQTSFQTDAAPGGTIDGATLTIVSNPFLASVNSALSNQTMVAGKANARIASFSLGASSAEAINLTSVTLGVSTSTDSSAGPLRVQNLKTQIGSTVLNYTVPSISASQTYTFSVPSGTMLIPAGGNVVVDVYGDVLQNSSAFPYTSPVKLNAAVGIGALTNTNQILKDTSNTAVSSANAIAGQNLTIGGSGALAILGVSNDPVTSEYTKGQLGATVAKFQLRETTNNESIKIITLKVTASSTNGFLGSSSPWQNLKLVDSNGVAIPGAGPLSMAVANGKGTVNFAPTNMDIPANGTYLFGVKSDVSSDENFFQNNNGINWVWNIAASSDVVAVGDGSSSSIVPTGAADANKTTTQTALGAKLSVQNFTKMPSVVINNSVDLKLGQVTFHTDGSLGNYAVLKQLKFTISGPALGTTASQTETVYLRNPGDVVIATTSVTFSSTTPSAVATLTVATSSTDGYVYQGSDKTFTVSMDTDKLVTPSTGNQNPTVSLQIGAASALTDVTFATYLASPNFTESFNLDRLNPNTPLPKTVVVGYQ